MIQVIETYIVSDSGYNTLLHKCRKHQAEWPHEQTFVWMLQAMRATCNETYGLVEINEKRAHELLAY